MKSGIEAWTVEICRRQRGDSKSHVRLRRLERSSWREGGVPLGERPVEAKRVRTTGSRGEKNKRGGKRDVSVDGEPRDKWNGGWDPGEAGKRYREKEGKEGARVIRVLVEGGEAKRPQAANGPRTKRVERGLAWQSRDWARAPENEAVKNRMERGLLGQTRPDKGHQRREQRLYCHRETGRLRAARGAGNPAYTRDRGW